MVRVEIAEAWKPFLRKISIELGIDPDYEDPSGRYAPLVEEIWSAPEVVAIWGPRRPQGTPPATDTATANATQGAATASAGVRDDGEGAVATTSREAGPEATNADEHSAVHGEVGSGLDGPASAAVSSPVMPRSPRPSRPTPMGCFDVLSMRPAAKSPKAVPPGGQTPNPTASPQQARALTTDSPPASAARLADKQESSAPAAPKPNQYDNDESPALTRKRKALHDLVDGYLRATCYKNWPSPPAAPPAPAFPAASSDRPDSPASSGPWSPPPFPGTRTGKPVDPDQDVESLELPPAVYSVPFTAPQRIFVDSFAEYPDKLPLTLPFDQDDLAVLRDVHPGGPEENAEAGNVADDEDEPGEYAL